MTTPIDADVREAIERTKDVLFHREEARVSRQNVTMFHRDRDIRVLVAAAERLAKLKKSLAEVFQLIESGYLVRDISNDGEPDWAIKQLDPVRKLAAARALIEPKP